MLCLGCPLGAQEDWLDERILDHLERVEAYEDQRQNGGALDRSDADAYFSSCIYLAGRIPSDAAADFGLLAMLGRASDLAQVLQRGQAVGEIAQMRAYFLEREARWDAARDVRLGALGSELALGISGPMLLIGQAQAEQTLGSIDQALLFADQAEERLFVDLAPETPGFDHAHVQILGVKGELRVVLGLLDQARPALDASLALAEELGNRELLVAALTRQAALLGAAKQAPALRRLIKRALADERTAGSGRLQVALALRLGICLATLGDPEDSGWDALLQAAGSTALNPLERFRAQAWLGNLSLRRGELVQARLWLGRAAQSIEVHTNARHPARELAFLRALESRLSLAAGAPRESLQRRKEALQVAYDGFLANWNTTPILPGGLAFLRYSSRDVILNAMLRLQLKLQAGEEGIAAALHQLHRAQAMGTTARRAGYRVPSLDQVRRTLLQADEGLLIFMPGEDGCHWFTLDATHLGHSDLPALHTLKQIQTELYKQITKLPAPGAAAPKLEAALLRMSRSLLPQDIRAQLGRWKAVTVIGLDALGYVPLEHLPFDARGELDQHLAVSYLQSIPMAMLLKQRPDPLLAEQGLDLYFHGPPQQGDNPIKLGDNQWKRMSAAFEPGRVQLARGAGATHASLRSPAAKGSRITHLLTHGLPGQGLIRSIDLQLTPERPGDTGRLSCDEADELELGALVVISACNAGQGPLRQGEDGGIGFGGAFLQGARTRAVVLSPAKLDLLAQYHLLPEFYSHLARGVPPAEALRRARLKLRKDPRFQHPYYSLMHVRGLGNAAIFPAQQVK